MRASSHDQALLMIERRVTCVALCSAAHHLSRRGRVLVHRIHHAHGEGNVLVFNHLNEGHTQQCPKSIRVHARAKELGDDEENMNGEENMLEAEENMNGEENTLEAEESTNAEENTLEADEDTHDTVRRDDSQSAVTEDAVKMSRSNLLRTINASTFDAYGFREDCNISMRDTSGGTFDIPDDAATRAGDPQRTTMQSDARSGVEARPEAQAQADHVVVKTVIAEATEMRKGDAETFASEKAEYSTERILRRWERQRRR